MDCLIAIVGGGASGLAAAVEAARRGASVTVLERLDRVGKKLLLTGNGRCNLGNEGAAADLYQGDKVLTGTVFAAFGDARAFFASLGLLCRADEAGRLYPASNAASSVLDALRLECARLGVTTLCGFRATALRREGGGFLLAAEDGRQLRAARVILAFGGKAAPKLGTDGSAFSLLSPFGLRPTALSPALCPLKCAAPELRALKGLRAAARVRAFRGERFLGESRGEVQFAEGALSGICVFDLAALQPDRLELDLLPELSREEVEASLLGALTLRSAAPLEEGLTGLFHKRLGQVLLKKATALPLTSPCSALGGSERRKLAALAKALPFPVAGGDWDKAQVTRGGVPSGELTEELELKKLPGVYLCGEAADVSGPCGGFNLHWAWASGRQAGAAAAKGA